MKVMFATPCYISAVSMHYVTSIFDLVPFIATGSGCNTSCICIRKA